jgi:hypothetical protein
VNNVVQNGFNDYNTQNFRNQVLALFKDLADTLIRIHYPEIIIFVPIFNGNDAI